MDEGEKVIDGRRLFEAKRELNEFLAKSPPHLREYQREIEKSLEKAGQNPHNRMTVLSMMMRENQSRLQKALEDLRDQLRVQESYLRIIAQNRE